MARQLHRLSPAKVKNAKPGMHADGGGLYLQAVEASDNTISKSWIFRFVIAGRERHMGLGPLRTVSLADARQRAAGARKLREQGQDPIEARDESRAAAAKASATAMTFDECRDAYIAAHRSGWRNAKHAWQWSATLEAHATPVIGRVFARDVDTAMVMKILEPIWTKIPETASRLRGRIELILDWAKARGHREGENPARWRGHLAQLLPPRSKVRKVRHHPAMPYDELPTFFKRLRKEDGAVARALEWTILNAARTKETIGATLDEINAGQKAWTIPGARMKAERDHRVPLSSRALAIADDLAPLREGGQHVFPGRGHGRPLSNLTMLVLLRRLGHAGITVHGFRSTFRDWAAERTNFPNEVVEMALAHALSDKVEAAYRRGDLFEKRRRLMEAWAEYCEHGQVTADVVVLRA